MKLLRKILLWSFASLLAALTVLSGYLPIRAVEDAASEPEYSVGILDTITGQTFTPLFSDDADRNGLPDNPFVSLPGVGEVWASTLRVEETGFLKSVVAKRWNGAFRNNEETFFIDIEVQSDALTPQRILIEAPYTLAEPGEAMVLLVSLAPDLETLLGGEQATLLSPEPDGSIVSGGQYIEISVLVSTDDGLTYDDLDETRLADAPIRLVMDDLSLDAVSEPSFYAHPTYIHSDATTGLSILADQGEWNPIDTRILEHEPFFCR